MGCCDNKTTSGGREPLPRASCLECVEKHLGAAAVLLSEIHVGYAYHLLFIGHLHEAEDESRQWPNLCQAVRKARREYQTRRIVPRWAEFERYIVSAREGTDIKLVDATTTATELKHAE